MTPTHEQNVQLCIRARRIADRIAPRWNGPTPDGFRQTADFITVCNIGARHNQTYRRVFRRLYEKASRDVQ